MNQCVRDMGTTVAALRGEAPLQVESRLSRTAPFGPPPPRGPLPVTNLRHIFAVFRNVLFVLDAFVAESLLGIVGLGPVQGDPINDIGDQMKPIQIVHHRHVKGGRSRAFFLVQYGAWCVPAIYS